LGVAGISCLFLGLCQGSVGAVATHGHSGHKSDPSKPCVAVLAAGLDMLEKKRLL